MDQILSGGTNAFASALLVVATLAACSNDLESLFESGSKDAGPTVNRAAGGFEFLDADCAACVSKSCEREALACAGEPTCKDFWSCRGACPEGDRTCENRCRTRSFPRGGGAYHVRESGELEACLAQHCESCSARHIFGTVGCDACVENTCTDVDWDAYAQDVVVQHLEACDASCVGTQVPDETRLGVCHCEQADDATQAAIARWQARRTCTTTSCQPECLGTLDLDCVGAVTRPQPVPEPILYRAVPWDPIVLPPVPVTGAMVSACSNGTDCDPALAGPVPQDEEGVAALRLPYRGSFRPDEPYAGRVEVVTDGFRFLLSNEPPIQQNITYWIPIVTRDALPLFTAGGLLPAFEPSKGVLFVIVEDCAGKNVPGVVVRTNPPVEVEPYYSGSASGTETGATGFAVFVNVPPGPVGFTATRDGEFYGQGLAYVIPSKDGITGVGLTPTPARE